VRVLRLPAVGFLHLLDLLQTEDRLALRAALQVEMAALAAAGVEQQVLTVGGTAKTVAGLMVVLEAE
jgi:hypothetical protein